MTKRILIVAGEASADRYGAKLVQRLVTSHSPGTLTFFGTGGDQMKAAGVNLVAHVRDLAHIGPKEAFTSLGNYYRAFRSISQQCSADSPALAILLDFPEFNLRLAKKMRSAGVKVIYYVSPQIWAWRRGRIRSVERYVDKMLVILPFEEDFYRRNGVKVEFVGHPLLEDFEPLYDRKGFLGRFGLDPMSKTVAILPGSRRKEIDYILPILIAASLRVLEKLPAQFLISAAPSIDTEQIRSICSGLLKGPVADRFRIVREQSRDLLANSDFGFVKSGTSTLEAALVGTPFLIAYRVSGVTWSLGKVLVNSPTKGLVNLIAGERIVPEFYQDDATPERLAATALDFLTSTKKAEALRQRLAGIRERLGCLCASERAAAAVNSYLM